MHFQLTALALAGLSLSHAYITPSSLFKREGINCEGSSDCELEKENSNTIQALADVITTAISNGHGSDNYAEGQQIACDMDDGTGTIAASGAVCVFFQKGASGTLQDADNYVHDLITHGCKLCGSVPTDGNDVDNGELTINYVSSPCGCTAGSNGACVCPA